MSMLDPLSDSVKNLNGIPNSETSGVCVPFIVTFTGLCVCQMHTNLFDNNYFESIAFF